MSTKDEFYRKLDAVVAAATDALKAIPTDMPEQQKKMWRGLLSRLPEQVPDIRATFDDEHLNARLNRGELEKKFGM